MSIATLGCPTLGVDGVGAVDVASYEDARFDPNALQTSPACAKVWSLDNYCLWCSTYFHLLPAGKENDSHLVYRNLPLEASDEELIEELKVLLRALLPKNGQDSVWCGIVRRDPSS